MFKVGDRVRGVSYGPTNGIVGTVVSLSDGVVVDWTGESVWIMHPSELELVDQPDAFDPDWPHGHVTRDGRKARIICTDARGNFPIGALVENDGGTYDAILAYRINGCVSMEPGRNADLLNAPAPTPIRLKVGQVVEDEAGRRGLVTLGPDEDGDYKVWFVSDDWVYYPEDGNKAVFGGYKITRIVLEPGE